MRFGVKTNSLREFAKFGCRVTVVPSDTSAADTMALNLTAFFSQTAPATLHRWRLLLTDQKVNGDGNADIRHLPWHRCSAKRSAARPTSSNSAIAAAINPSKTSPPVRSRSGTQPRLCRFSRQPAGRGRGDPHKSQRLKPSPGFGIRRCPFSRLYHPESAPIRMIPSTCLRDLFR